MFTGITTVLTRSDSRATEALKEICLHANATTTPKQRAYIRQSSRSALDRCLRRHGVARRAELLPEVEGKPPLPKTFKDDEPGFVHVDVKYLPQMPDEAEHRYLIAAIDRASR